MFGGAVATSAAEQGGVVTLGATVAAADGDDTLGTVTITGLSNDLTNFNGGSYTASTGTWTGTAAQFDALTFKAGEDGVQHLTITAATTGAEAGSTTENYTLTVNPVAEGPVLGGAISATVGQGGVVTLGATDTVSDADDALGSVTITGLPGDLTSFSGGSYTASSGTWTGTAAQFNALTFNAGGPGTFALSISASTTGAEAGSSSESYTLTVSNIGPLVSGTIGTANEGATVTLGLTDAVRDAGDTLGTVTITGLSNDLTNFNGGSYTASTGTWTGTATQFNALTFTAGEDGSHNITISATESGVGGGTTTANYTLTVNPVAEGPVFGGAVAASAAEQGGVVTLGATVAAADSDDTLGTVTITGLSNDLTNFNGGSYTSSTGTWTGTAAQFDALTFKAGEDGVQHLTITAATTGAEAGSSSENYTLTVNPVAEGPVFGGAVAASAAEQGGVVTLGATVAAADSDDTLGTVTITGLSNDLTNFNGGSYTSSTGTWSGTAAQFDALTFKTGEDGVQHLTITAATTGAEAGSTTENYTLTVNPVAEGPVLGGAISATVRPAGPVTLGATVAAADSDDTLGTVTISGLPGDLSNFNGGTYTSSTGTWTGTAAQFDALTFTAGGGGTFALSISATTTGAEAGTTSENYTLNVAVYQWINTAGGAWTTAGNWSGGVVPHAGDAATINISGSYVVTISSAAAVYSLAVSDAGATVAINSGGTLTLAGSLTATAGTVELNSGGIITGGTLVASGGTFSWAGGTLDGVTYQGILDLSPTSASVFIKDGFTGGSGGATINLTGASSSLYSVGTETLDNATINFGNSGNYSYLRNYDTSSSQVLTLGANLIIDHVGTYAQLDDSYDSRAGSGIVNDGTINANLSGGTFIITDGTFTNQGAINVSNGDTLTINAPSWSNSGLITDSGGTLNLGGSFTTASLQLGTLTHTAGTVNITGTLDNTGATLNLGTGTGPGTLTLASGGTIKNGTIIAATGIGVTGSGGTLDGVTYQGILDLSPTSASVFVKDGFTGGSGGATINLTGASSSLYSVGTETLDNATINFGNSGNYSYLRNYDTSSSQVLTLGANLIIDHVGTFAQLDDSYD